MDRDKEIRELINNDLSEKSLLLMKYKYKVYKITDNISHWFPYIRYSEPNLKFKYINAPLCNWTVNIDLSDNDNIVLLNNVVYGKELSIDEQYYCNCLFNYIKCNKIVVDYDIEESFEFSNEEETSYIYSIIKKMLAVFNEDNIEEYAKMLCSRCLFGYHKKQYYFLYRDIKYENSLYLMFNYNPDVSLSYLMIYFIEKLGYFETLVALYYFKLYNSYDTIVSDSDIINYIHNREEKEDIVFELDKFKIYLYNQYKKYIDICNSYRLNFRDTTQYILDTKDENIINEYFRADSEFDEWGRNLGLDSDRNFIYKNIRKYVLNAFEENSMKLKTYDYDKVCVYSDVYHWFPCIRYSDPNLKFKYINAPLCNWSINIDLTDNETILLNMNTHKSLELSETEYSYAINLVNYIKSNKIVDYDIEEVFDFSNEDESSYIYSIIKKMLTVFNEDSIREYAELIYERSGFSYIKKGNGLYEIFKYNPDVSLSYLMIYFIEKLGYFETLVALYYFKLYNSYDTIVSDSDVIDYIHNREEKEDILYEIKKFKIYLNDLYMDYIDICIDNDNKKLDIMGEIFRKHRFGEISNNYFKQLDDFKKYKIEK